MKLLHKTLLITMLAITLPFAGNATAAVGDVVNIQNMDVIPYVPSGWPPNCRAPMPYYNKAGLLMSPIMNWDVSDSTAEPCTMTYIFNTPLGEPVRLWTIIRNIADTTKYSTEQPIDIYYLDQNAIEQVKHLTVDATTHDTTTSFLYNGGQNVTAYGKYLGNFASITKIVFISAQSRSSLESAAGPLSYEILEPGTPVENPDAMGLLPPAPQIPEITGMVGHVAYFYNARFAEAAGYIPMMNQWVYAEDYPALVYGITGDEYATEVQLRDCRGEFIRGKDLNRGVDPNRENQWQADELKSHNHEIEHAGFANSGRFGFETGTGSYIYETEYTGGDETRPRNIDMLCAINPGEKQTPEE